ncbi:MAG: hypothetical protein V1797_17220 [Pseudomonadota bacterium]
MDRFQVRGQLLAKRYTLIQIAAELGVSRQRVSLVVNGHYLDRRVMTHIAGILEQDPVTVFPWAAHLFNSPEIPQSRAY